MGADRHVVSALRPMRPLAKTVHAVLAGYANPAHLLELVYWSEEPGVLEIIRSVVAMPAETQVALRRFLSAASNPQKVGIVASSAGELTLSSLTSAKTTKVQPHPTAPKIQRPILAEQTL